MKSATILIILCCLVSGTGHCQTTALQPVDAFDTFEARGHSDRLLLMGPGAVQTVYLQLSNPDSVVVVIFDGSFSTQLFNVVTIAPASSAWDGAIGTPGFLDPLVNNEAGTFQAMSMLLDSPWGLSHEGNRNFFVMQITPRELLSPENPVITGSLAINNISSRIGKTDGSEHSGWVSQDLIIKLAYVGDIASAVLGVTGTVPYLTPQPDGVVDFHDMVVFVDGWNGNGVYQDKIADIDVLPGGIAPDLIPDRDNQWDQDDIDALLTNWTWFDQNRETKELSNMAAGQNPVDQKITVSGTNLEDGTAIEIESDLGVPIQGEKFEVILRVHEADRLMAASIGLTYDPGQLKFLFAEAGEMLKREASVIAHIYEGDGEVEYCLGRLSTNAPGISGDGYLMIFSFQVILPPDNGLRVAYDLRDENRLELAAGEINIGVYDSSPGNHLVLSQNFPNPFRTSTNLVFSLPDPSQVDLAIFDLNGRRIVTLMDELKETDTYTVGWNRADQSGREVPAGIYFYRLQTDSGNLVRRLTVVR